MLIRFLIVALAILNLSVALWWMAPRTVAPVAPETAEAGVATLELMPAAAVEAPAPSPPSDSAPAAGDMPAANAVPTANAPIADNLPAAASTPVPLPPPPLPEPRPEQRCISLGPFDNKDHAQAAIATLGADLLRSRLREASAKPPASYRVMIPPAATHEAAQAMAKRIVDAGFKDWFIVGQGDEANAVALGQYRNRESAQRRLQTLTDAGFPAQIMASEPQETPSWWLDAAYAGTTAADSLQRRSGAAQQRSLDCAGLR